MYLRIQKKLLMQVGGVPKCPELRFKSQMPLKSQTAVQSWVLTQIDSNCNLFISSFTFLLNLRIFRFLLTAANSNGPKFRFDSKDRYEYHPVSRTGSVVVSEAGKVTSGLQETWLNNSISCTREYKEYPNNVLSTYHRQNRPLRVFVCYPRILTTTITGSQQ